MEKLLNLVLKNKNLEYIDPKENTSLKIDQLPSLGFFNNASKRKFVFLYLDNSINSIIIFWNLIKSRHAGALLSPYTKNEYKRHLESIYKPDLIYDPSRNLIKGYVAKNEYKKIKIHSRRKPFGHKLHPSLKILLSTSGTTGSPKFVKISENNLVNNALSIIDYLPINRFDTTPLNLAIYYSYGLSILTTNSIAGGKIICLNCDLLTKEFWRLFKKYKFSSIAGVPYTYELLYKIGLQKNHYPFLKYMTQAGGKLNNNLIKIFADYSKKNKIKFFIMYGQTEATARISFLYPDFLNKKIGSIGKPIKNGFFRIDRKAGELIYKGPNVFGGYAVKPADLAEFSTNTVLYTGDLAKSDNDGFYYITGRLKRFIKIGGTRTNLDETDLLLKSKFVKDTFACLGIEDKLLLVITDSTPSPHKEASIKKIIQNKTDINPNYVRVSFISKFLLTQNGKINYSELQNKYGHL